MNTKKDIIVRIESGLESLPVISPLSVKQTLYEDGWIMKMDTLLLNSYTSFRYELYTKYVESSFKSISYESITIE